MCASRNAMLRSLAVGVLHACSSVSPYAAITSTWRSCARNVRSASRSSPTGRTMAGIAGELATPTSPPGPSRLSGRHARSVVRPEDDLDRAVALLLEQLVRIGSLGERHTMGGEIEHTERVRFVGHQRHEVADPALDVRLAHAQGQLLVEHLH